MNILERSEPRPEPNGSPLKRSENGCASNLMELLRFCKEETLSSVILKKTCRCNCWQRGFNKVLSKSCEYTCTCYNLFYFSPTLTLVFRLYLGWCRYRQNIQTSYRKFPSGWWVQSQAVFGGRWRTMFTCSMFSPGFVGSFQVIPKGLKWPKYVNVWLLSLWQTGSRCDRL